MGTPDFRGSQNSATAGGGQEDPNGVSHDHLLDRFPVRFIVHRLILHEGFRGRLDYQMVTSFDRINNKLEGGAETVLPQRFRNRIMDSVLDQHTTNETFPIVHPRSMGLVFGRAEHSDCT